MKEDMKNFETALSELEALVRKLESDVAIDEATKAFAEGIRLSKICMEELKAEKGKISLLIDELNNLTEEITID
ncbi:MAG: exodeoxyribonuclease VII small subunit [Clostridia bacterium]|nr:exodeoxyribonuclease VII small subunit [Clostridia bacterium]MBO5982644.1 exodeoxyribonuclease VII small subunit [Clostridia bacterium]MBO7151446.1 exodeoxyribonuclease VII small subunit [Clostridia bacterium]MBO7222483.1 exodeoxyribonuclease VII small subunit [Clostridia bacterium]MBO7326850.1 exodeoxyribonuclease VII small subunit [Clostridia bacterium]